MKKAYSEWCVNQETSELSWSDLFQSVVVNSDWREEW